MKTFLICLAVVGAALAADPNYTDPADIIKADGVLVISDGSSLYEFKNDGTFHSHPMGMDGRLLDGTWTSGGGIRSMTLTATAKMSWVNGPQPKDEYRKIVFLLYPGGKRPPDKRRIGELQHKEIFDCYFLIQEFTKITKPEK